MLYRWSEYSVSALQKSAVKIIKESNHWTNTQNGSNRVCWCMCWSINECFIAER